MKRVGELIEETIEAMEMGATDAAFALTCAAIQETLKKSLETEDLTGGDYQRFVKQHWQLISFMGLPCALPMPLNVDFKLNTILHGFRVSGAEELILHLVRQTAVMSRTPAQFKFHSGSAFEIRGQQIFIPATLIGGLVGIVIFQPENKGESVSDKYWINISDFKMFISEFWGRIDLAERIMNFYLG
ncbi:MAG: hypothetical protein ACR2HG_14835 [Pyrinomonadaceae bacterium]